MLEKRFTVIENQNNRLAVLSEIYFQALLTAFTLTH